MTIVTVIWKLQTEMHVVLGIWAICVILFDHSWPRKWPDYSDPVCQ